MRKRKLRANSDDAVRAAERLAFSTNEGSNIAEYWKLALRAGKIPKPTRASGQYKIWNFDRRNLSRPIVIHTAAGTIFLRAGPSLHDESGRGNYQYTEETLRDCLKVALETWEAGTTRFNPDDEIRRLERIHAALGPEDTESWTALAVARERAGLMWPAPPPSFAPGFREMSNDELRQVFHQAYTSRSRVEVIFRPGHGMLLGKVWDWPKENPALGLPSWMKIRFRVGLTRQSPGRTPYYMMFANRRSRSGVPIGYGPNGDDYRGIVWARVV